MHLRRAWLCIALHVLNSLTAHAITIEEFAVPTNDAGLSSISAGPDGNLWFVERSADRIGRITPAGVITEFNLPAGSQPRDIATGPDGNLWFTEYGSNTIGMITPAGVITPFAIGATTGPSGIVSGP